MRDHLVRWHEEHAHEGLVVIEIDGGRHQALAATKEQVRAKGVRHPVLWDKDNRNHKRYGVRTWPRACLIGPDGRVLWLGNPDRILRRLPERWSVDDLVRAASCEARESGRPSRIFARRGSKPLSSMPH